MSTKLQNIKPAPNHGPVKRAKRVVKKRPSETGTAVIAALVLLANRVFGLSPEVTSAAIVLIGFVPSAITAVVQYIDNLKSAAKPTKHKIDLNKTFSRPDK